MGYCTDWCTTKADEIYHNTEWGRPLHDDRKQFEFLMLEVMQCGLSWQLMLKNALFFINVLTILISTKSPATPPQTLNVF